MTGGGPAKTKKRLVIAMLLVAMIGARPAMADPATVSIENFTFKPAALSIHEGTIVTFKNADDIPHSVVMADGSFHSKALDTDEQTTMLFTKSGDFSYFCGLHPHMQGKVTVVP